MNYCKNLTILILVVAPFTSHAQDIGNILRVYFNNVRTGKDVSVPKEIILPEKAKDVLAKLPTYLYDTASLVRSNAYNITKMIGLNSKLLPVRTQTVQQLIAGTRDSDSGNASIVIDYLRTFNKSDFGPASKDSLISGLYNRVSNLDELIKLLGFLEITRIHTDLQNLTQPGNPKSNRWAAMLALSRMGDQAATDNILNRVRKIRVNDDVVYQIFPDLIYTRHTETIAYLVEALNSDEKNCESADAEHGGKIPCAYRVMEMLAPVIKDFPLKVDESGDIDTKDYVGALQTAREWFRQNPNYTILKDRY